MAHQRAKDDFSYDAENDDELSFQANDIIVVVAKIDEGWWEGELNGRRGIFPANFVQVIADEPPPPRERTNTNTAAAAGLVRGASVSKGPAPPPPAAAKSAAAGRKRARVVHSFAAEQPDEIDLEPGTIVDVEREVAEGWWEGSVGGKKGLFPSNFVVVEEDDAASAAAAPPAAQKPAEPEPAVEIKPKKAMGVGFGNILGGAKLKSAAPAPAPAAAPEPKEPEASQPAYALPIRKKPGEKRMRATFDYTAENPDELTFAVGDVITNVTSVGEGWAQGDLNGKSGLFPSNFAEALPDEEPEVKKKGPAPAPPVAEKKAVPLPADAKK
eukprot:Opistho-1_new@16219